MIDLITIDKIKEAANVKDILEDFGYTLKKKGTKYHCLCPFHNDHNLGSFVVNPVKGTYACYSCGARGNAIDFLMHHEHYTYVKALQYLGKKYDVDIDGAEGIEVKKAPPRPPTPPKATLILPAKMVQLSMKDIDDTPFIKWLKALPWDAQQRARINEVLWLYCVARDKKGWSLFWQIDEQRRVLNGKFMKYKPDGHRDKGEEDEAKGRKPYVTDWVHSRLKRRYKPEDPLPYPDLFDPDKQEEHYTFFGMHLLDRYPKATINIVESEKTALICAIAYGSPEMNLWMACGGKTWLSNERMDVLFRQKRRIVLYPDTDGMDEWADWIKLMNQPSMTVEREFFTRYYRPELDGKKADIADILIRWMKESAEGRPHHQKDPEAVGEIIARNPEINKLVDPTWVDGDPFYTLTPLQQRLRDAIESKHKLYRKAKTK